MADIQTTYTANDIMDMANYNTMQSAQAAAAANAQQSQWYSQMQDFNALEAAKSRDWQAYMSNTAHQREVADMVKAGLNPVLSVTGGSGASVGSGATASSSMPSSAHMGQVDMSQNGSIISMITGLANAAAAVEASQNSAGAMMYSAQQALKGTEYSSDISKEVAQIYADANSNNTLLGGILSIIGGVASSGVSAGVRANALKSLKGFK